MDQLVGFERLADVIVSALLQGLHRGFDGRVTGHDDDDEIRIRFVKAALQLDAIDPRHFDVEQRDVPGVRLKGIQCIVGAGDGLYGEAFLL